MIVSSHRSYCHTFSPQPPHLCQHWHPLQDYGNSTMTQDNININKVWEDNAVRAQERDIVDVSSNWAVVCVFLICFIFIITTTENNTEGIIQQERRRLLSQRTVKLLWLIEYFPMWILIFYLINCFVYLCLWGLLTLKVYLQVPVTHGFFTPRSRWSMGIFFWGCR